MSNRFYTESLVKEQYKNSDNLGARQNLHTYNINKQDWHVWFFEKMDIPEGSRILELGCGNGLLWENNISALKDSWDITLSDFSEGMLQSAQHNINNHRIKYEIINIQNIPYEEESFDVVVARHMLYHVEDIDKALSEVKRVLKRSGRFYVSTNGLEHMRELKTLLKNSNIDMDYNPEKYAERFGLENGEKYLSKYFNEVTVQEFKGEIVVDKAEPVVSYIASAIGTGKGAMDEHGARKFHEFLKEEIDCKGSIRITTQTGMLKAAKF